MMDLPKIFQLYKQNTTAKKIIYTSVFGNFDQLHEIQNPDKHIDYICFTDSKDLISKTWKIIECELGSNDFRKCAKIFKVFPHEFFPNAESSLWVDGNYLIKKNHVSFIEKYTNNLSIKFFRHSARECIFDEGDYLIKNKPEFDPSIIRDQLLNYLNQGMPKKVGLINGAIILRNNQNEEVRKLMWDWWIEIDNHSIRDQLSFNYICWKNQYKLEFFQEEIINFQYFQFMPHGSRINYLSILNIKIFIKKTLKKIHQYVRNN
tara:strand:+ start:125 stop:910 length:786 start_codon:yes stop_codon:yes gene_type:complete